MTVRMILLALISTLVISGCSWQKQDSATTVKNKPVAEKIISQPKVKPDCPSIDRAARWARRKSNISFALICKSRVRGYQAGRHSQSASTGKALMLLAFLRRGQRVAAAKPTLSRMIRFSDNAAAHQVYAMLGDPPLQEAARRAGLKTITYCGCWSYISWSPADYARLFYSLPGSLPRANRWWAMKTLSDITPEQSWGIPAIARKQGYTVYFKGGWRPDPGGWIVLQGASLRRGDQKLALAVFTRNQAGLAQGAQKIKTVTRLILG